MSGAGQSVQWQVAAVAGVRAARASEGPAAASAGARASEGPVAASAGEQWRHAQVSIGGG